jgi:hypothetical protein
LRDVEAEVPVGVRGSAATDLALVVANELSSTGPPASSSSTAYFMGVSDSSWWRRC